jgi:hypothetical protein
MQQSRILSRSTVQTSWKAMADTEKVWVRARLRKSSRLISPDEQEHSEVEGEQQAEGNAFGGDESGAAHCLAT